MGSNPTLVRVFLCPCVGPIPILGLIPDGIIGYKNFTVVLGLIRTCNHYVISLYPKCPKSSLRMKLSNNHLNLLNNIKEIQQKEREAWLDTTSWTRLKPDCIWVILKKSRPYVFLVYGKSPALKAVFAQNRLVCDVNDDFISNGITHYHFGVLNL